MDMKKHNKTLLAALLAMMIGWGCTGKKTQQQPTESDTMVVEVSTPDSTVYGVCGEGTSMHALELVTDEGDTLTYLVDADTEQETVKGGLFAGDRMAVVGYKGAEGDMVATCAVNLTTLMGKWTSIDKNFEIQEGGLVESSIKAETRPWTSWKIHNGQLLLNADTFAIERLGADSLFLENGEGIFVFKRQRQQ